MACKQGEYTTYDPYQVIFEFLDIGQGDSTLIFMPTGEIVLVDFGEKRTPHKVGYNDTVQYLMCSIAKNSAELGLARPTIDHLFITHPDQDHYNHIPDLLTADWGDYDPKYSGKKLLINRVHFGGEKRAYGGLIDDLDAVCSTDIRELADSARCRIDAKKKTVKPSWTYGKVNIYLLSSNYPRATSKKNDLSLVLMVEYDLDNGDDNPRCILTGDAGFAVESGILSAFKNTGNFLKAHSLKLGHHGSASSSSDTWLEAVGPKAVFASGDFVWAHPYCEAVTRALNNGTLESFPKDIFFCCGTAGYYYNRRTKLQACLNLWFTVSPEDGKQIVYLDEKILVGDTYGTQWQLTFLDTAKIEIDHTAINVKYFVK